MALIYKSGGGSNHLYSRVIPVFLTMSNARQATP